MGNNSSKIECPKVRREMQGCNCNGFRGIKMGVYDMILCVDWVKQYGPMIFDFANSLVKFNFEDMDIILQG